MEINFTLFVQMGNFFVAYIMLRTLFLNPALRLLQQIEKRKNDAHSELQQHESKLIEQRNQLQVEWNAYKRYCKEAKPSVVEIVRTGPGQEGGVACAIPSVTPEQMRELASDLEERITTKVSHVRT